MNLSLYLSFPLPPSLGELIVRFPRPQSLWLGPKLVQPQVHGKNFKLGGALKSFANSEDEPPLNVSSKTVPLALRWKIGRHKGYSAELPKPRTNNV